MEFVSNSLHPDPQRVCQRRSQSEKMTPDRATLSASSAHFAHSAQSFREARLEWPLWHFWPTGWEIMGPFLRNHVVICRSSWDQFLVIIGLFSVHLGHHGFIFGSSWCHFRVIMGLLEPHQHRYNYSFIGKAGIYQCEKTGIYQCKDIGIIIGFREHRAFLSVKNGHSSMQGASST